MPGTKSVVFGLTVGFADLGVTPDVAINEDNVVLEIHRDRNTERKADGNKLYWRIGLVQGVNVVWLPKIADYHEFNNGDEPAVAMRGDVALVMWQFNNFLHYSTGTVRRATVGSTTAQLEFKTNGPQVASTFQATDVSVAVNRSGVVLEVHRQTVQLSFIAAQRGLLDGETLTFAPSGPRSLTYGPTLLVGENGARPAVAINNNGQAVVAFELAGKLRYTVGTFDAASTDVQSPITWSAPVEYDTGERPSIVLTDDGYVFALHASGTGVFQRTGVLRNGAIEWQDVLAAGNGARRYDTGITPAIATNGTTAIQVYNRSDLRVNGGIYASACLVFDRANWMGDRRTQLIGKTLRQLVLPASHDSGAVDDTVARTQDLSFAGQLAYGIRWFDVRPEYNGNKTDNPIDLDKMVTYHDVHTPFIRYVPGVPLRQVVAEVAAFAASHSELVILKLSHFRNFDQHVYDALHDLINTQLLQYLFVPPDRALRSGDPQADAGKPRYADLPLRLGLLGAGRSTVLILVDVDTNNSNADYVTTRSVGFYTYRDWYAPDPENGDFTVFDVFSSTDDFNTMALSTAADEDHPTVPGAPDLPRGQIPKYGRFDGKCRGTGNQRSSVQCDLFLFSWTITPPIVHDDVTPFNKSVLANPKLVEYTVRPDTIGNNPQGLPMNLIYTDAVETSRSVDVAMVRNFG